MGVSVERAATGRGRRGDGGIAYFCRMASIALVAENPERVEPAILVMDGLRDNRGPSGRRLVAVEPF